MKRIVCLLLCLLVLAGVLAGCGGAETGLSERAEESSPAVYKAEAEKLPILGYGEGGRLAAVSGDRLLLASWDQEGAQRLSLWGYSLYRKGLGLDREQAADIPLPEGSPFIYDLAAGPDGGFYALVGEAPATYQAPSGEFISNDEYGGNFLVLRLGPEGEILAAMSFSAGDGEGPSRLAAGPGGRVFLFGRSSYFCLDPEGETEISGSTDDPDGDIIDIISQGDRGYILSYNYLLGQYSFAELWEGEKTSKRLRWQELKPSGAPAEGQEYLFSSGEELRFVAFEKGSLGLIGSLDAPAQLSPLKDLAHIEPGVLFLIDSQGRPILWEHRLDEQKEKLELRAAVLSHSHLISEQTKKFQRFNMSSDSIHISWDCYDETQVDQFLTEVISGNCPDLVMGSLLDTNNQNYVDLYAYLDNDPDLSREDLVPSLLKALEYDGELHEIWDRFNLFYACVREEEAGSQDFRFESLEDVEAFAAANPQRKFFVEPIQRMNVLYYTVEVGSAMFVDWESKSCRFDSKEFGNYLQWCKMVYEKIAPDDIGQVGGPVTYNYPEDVLIVIYNLGHPGGLNNHYKYMGPFIFPGFPGAEDIRAIFDYLSSYNSRIAIPTGSKNKEAAWEFIKYTLLSDRQFTTEDYGFPVNIDGLHYVLEHTDFEDEEGKELTINRFLELIEDTSIAMDQHGAVINDIIMEEVPKYLEGGKELEDVQDAIQSRVSVYLKERSW